MDPVSLKAEGQRGRGQAGAAGAPPRTPPGEMISPGPPRFALRLRRAAETERRARRRALKRRKGQRSVTQRPFFSAREDFRLQRNDVFQRSGGLPFAAQRPFFNARGPRATSGARPTTASRRDSLPPLNAAGVVQVPRPYSVSGADGRSRYSGEGKCRPQVGGIHFRR